MSTAMDKEAIKEAYMEVMSDGNGIEWWVALFYYSIDIDILIIWIFEVLDKTVLRWCLKIF